MNIEARFRGMPVIFILEVPHTYYFCRTYTQNGPKVIWQPLIKNDVLLEKDNELKL